MQEDPLYAPVLMRNWRPRSRWLWVSKHERFNIFHSLYWLYFSWNFFESWKIGVCDACGDPVLSAAAVNL